MWLAVLFVVIGPLVSGLGIREARYQRRLQRQGLRAEGVVVRHRVKRSGDKGHVTFAVVNFVDVKGYSHEFQPQSSGVKGLPVGGRTPVLYLPGVAQSARLEGSKKKIEHLVATLLGGLVFTGIGVWMIAHGV